TERGRNAAIVRGNRHRVERTAAVPDCGEARGAENFPAMGVGDAQRQTAVGEALIDVVHPIAVDRRGTNVDGVAVDDISGELHGAFHRIAATRKALDCGDPLPRNPTTSIAGWGAHTASGHVAVAPPHCPPRGSGQDIVPPQTSTREEAACEFRLRSLSGQPMSERGYNQPFGDLAA